MIIKSILKRYSNKYDSSLNIISTHCDNKRFEKFFQKVIGKESHIITMEESAFGNLAIDLILCHNKINYLDKCGKISYFFHCPILVIDHDIKPKFIDKDIIEHQSDSIYSIALNTQIYNSWQKTHNTVLGFDITSQESIGLWKNLLYQISKTPFNLKEKEYQKEKDHEPE